MDITLSFEYSGDIDNSIMYLWNNFKMIFNNLTKNNNYGEEFQDISIIPTIKEEKYLGPDWKERRLVRPKSKDADIRLIMDYDKFVKADENGRLLLYVKMLVDAIKIVDAKKKGDFNGEKLIEDLLAATNIKWDEIKDLDELDPRYPLSRTAKENNDLAKQR